MEDVSPLTRKIDGLTYYCYDPVPVTGHVAEVNSKHYRARGYNARTVRVSTGYLVYTYPKGDPEATRSYCKAVSANKKGN